MRAKYIGEEFPEWTGNEYFIETDLNDEGCFIMYVGKDVIPSIPEEDLQFN